MSNHLLRIAASALAGLSLETLQRELDADMLKRGITDKKVTIVADDSDEAERRVAQLIEMRSQEQRFMMLPRNRRQQLVIDEVTRIPDKAKIAAAEAKRARKNAKRLAENPSTP